MKTRINLENAIGKTLTGTAEKYDSSQVALIFGDEYLCLGIARGYESGDESIQEECLDFLDFGEDALISSGIISEKEIDSLRRKQQTEYQRRIALNEKQTYERLRAKFEANTQNPQP